MNTLKKFFSDLRDDTDDIRKRTLIAVGTTVAALVAGIVLTKLNEDRVDVIIIEEKRREDIVVPIETDEV